MFWTPGGVLVIPELLALRDDLVLFAAAAEARSDAHTQTTPVTSVVDRLATTQTAASRRYVGIVAPPILQSWPTSKMQTRSRRSLRVSDMRPAQEP